MAVVSQPEQRPSLLGLYRNIRNQFRQNVPLSARQRLRAAPGISTLVSAEKSVGRFIPDTPAPGQVLSTGETYYPRINTQPATQETVQPLSVSPLSFSPVGGSGGSGVNQSEVDFQRKQIEDARRRFQERATRYGQFFEMQKQQLEANKAQEEMDIAQAREQAGISAQQGREGLAAQNVGNMAAINRGAQVAGTFDSSARLDAENRQNVIYNSTLAKLNDEEAQYYQGLDRQLQQVRDQYRLQKAQMDLQEFDTAEEYQQRLAQFDMAEQELNNRIAQLRASAAQRAAGRTLTLSEYIEKLPKIYNDLRATGLSNNEQVLSSVAKNLGVPEDRFAQDINRTNLIYIINNSDDPDEVQAAIARLSQIGG